MGRCSIFRCALNVTQNSTCEASDGKTLDVFLGNVKMEGNSVSHDVITAV